MDALQLKLCDIQGRCYIDFCFQNNPTLHENNT